MANSGDDFKMQYDSKSHSEPPDFFPSYTEGCSGGHIFLMPQSDRFGGRLPALDTSMTTESRETLDEFHNLRINPDRFQRLRDRRSGAKSPEQVMIPSAIPRLQGQRLGVDEVNSTTLVDITTEQHSPSTRRLRNQLMKRARIFKEAQRKAAFSGKQARLPLEVRQTRQRRKRKTLRNIEKRLQACRRDGNYLAEHIACGIQHVARELEELARAEREFEGMDLQERRDWLESARGPTNEQSGTHEGHDFGTTEEQEPGRRPPIPPQAHLQTQPQAPLTMAATALSFDIPFRPRRTSPRLHNPPS